MLIPPLRKTFIDGGKISPLALQGVKKPGAYRVNAFILVLKFLPK